MHKKNARTEGARHELFQLREYIPRKSVENVMACNTFPIFQLAVMTGKNPRPSLNFSCPFELASADIQATLDPPEKEKRRL